jgi:Mg-chelatase subunit ChlD
LNILCVHCGKQFSITAEQLGTRGKCPHCGATIRLPKAESGFEGHRELQKPSSWSENWMSGLGSLILHTFLLLLLLLVPWGGQSGDEGHEGESVAIGELDRNSLEQGDSNWERTAVRPEDRQFFQPSEETVQPLSDQAAWADEALSVRIPALSGGADPSLRFDTSSASAAQGGAQDFGEMVTQLKRDGLDIVLAFDSTGSMDSEIRQVKNKIEKIGTALFQLVPKTRISVCTYRDHGDEYVVKGLKLTDNLGKVSEYLDSIAASGGGDEPEAVDQGLSWSIEENAFRPRARKVILLFGDAPPHPSRRKTCLNLAGTFRRQQNGIVSTVTCHSDRRLEDFVEISQVGGGESFLARDEQEIMTQLMVLVFGSTHREKVIQALDLLAR